MALTATAAAIGGVSGVSAWPRRLLCEQLVTTTMGSIERALCVGIAVSSNHDTGVGVSFVLGLHPHGNSFNHDRKISSSNQRLESSRKEHVHLSSPHPMIARDDARRSGQPSCGSDAMLMESKNF
jgi:hypothetical protein